MSREAIKVDARFHLQLSLAVPLRRVASRSGFRSGRRSLFGRCAARFTPALRSTFRTALWATSFFGILPRSASWPGLGPRLGSWSRPRFWSGAGTSTASIFRQTNPSAVEIGIVEWIERLLHSLARLELDDTFIPSLFVGVGVRHFSSLTHVVFQVLPWNAGGEIFNNETVSGSWPRGTTSRRRPTPVIKSIVVTSVIASTTASTAPTSGTTRVLNCDTLTSYRLTVQVIDGVFSITCVLEFYKSKPIFEQDVAQMSVTLEKPLEISFACSVSNSSDVNSRSHPEFVEGSCWSQSRWKLRNVTYALCS